MPSFDASTITAAPPEEVWKLLYDPSRFPEWWVGVETVETGSDDQYTMYPTGYPDFPMPQLLSSSREQSRVRISCLVSDLVFTWQLEEAGAGTAIAVHVEIPDAEAARMSAQTAVIRESLANLAALAAAY